MFTKIDRETTIKVTMMEIYKEKLRDLLDPSRKPVIVGTSNGVHVKNVQVAEIQSLLDMVCIFIGVNLLLLHPLTFFSPLFFFVLLYLIIFSLSFFIFVSLFLCFFFLFEFFDRNEYFGKV